MKLQKPCARVAITRDARYKFIDPTVGLQCDLIERAMNGCNEATRDLTYQQAVLDVKLALSERFKQTSPLPTGRPIESPIPLSPTSAREIRTGLSTLRTLHNNHDKKFLSWMKVDASTVSLVDLNEAESSAFFKQVLGGPRAAILFDHWVAGLITTFNPF